mmetsp:Transcript_142300/g.354596  ORF Transcript_142300/g.354596 Transcript_142300/m.354596 type:complete len:255 (+) Transcript_142300:530-1294(+)
MVGVREDPQEHIGRLDRQHLRLERLDSCGLLRMFGVVAHGKQGVATGIWAAEHSHRPLDVRLCHTFRSVLQVGRKSWRAEEQSHQEATRRPHSAQHLQGVGVLHHLLYQRLLSPHRVGGHVLEKGRGEHAVLGAIELVVQEVHGVKPVLGPLGLETLHVRPGMVRVSQAPQALAWKVQLFLFLPVQFLVGRHLLSLDAPSASADDVANHPHALACPEELPAPAAGAREDVEQELPEVRAHGRPVLVQGVMGRDI